MFKYLGHFLVGLLLTNWLYSELILIVPEAEHISNRVSQVVKLPTHNEWPAIANSPRAVQLNSEINQSLSRVLPGRSRVFGPKVSHLWKQRVSPRVARLFGPSVSKDEDSNLMYVKDEDVFEAQARFVKFHDSYSQPGAAYVRRF